MGNGYLRASPDKNPGPPTRQSAVCGEDIIYISMCSGGEEVEPLRPSGRDYDPDRLSPRLAGVRVVRSAMVAGQVGHRPATRPQG